MLFSALLLLADAFSLPVPALVFAATDDVPESLREAGEALGREVPESPKEGEDEAAPARAVPPEVQAILSKGNRFYALGDYDAARVQYLEAIRKDPGSPEGHYGLGMTYLALGDVNAAIIAWRRAGGVDSVTAGLFDEFRSFRSARDAVQSQLMATRRSQAEAVAREEQPVSERYVGRGASGLFDSSNRAMLGRLDIPPEEETDTRAQDGELPPLGNTAFPPPPDAVAGEDLAQEQLPRAATEMPLSVQNVPDTPRPGGPAPPAVAALSPEQAADPKARGIYYVQTGNDQGAVTAFEEVLATDPRDSDALSYLAGLYLAGGRADDAEGAYKRLARLEPASSVPLTNLGGLYLNLGRFDEASTTLQEALRLDPSDSLAINNLAGVYYKTGRVDDAVRELNRAIEINPEDLNSHNNLAGIYYRQERFEKAIEELQRILSLDPSHAVAAANLEEAYKRKREFESARSERKMRARQIVLPSEEEAKAVRAEIQDGNDFVRLARERSIDQTAAKGGDLGFFDKGDLDSEAEEAIRKLAPGEISGVVKTPGGYSIFQRLD
ncbi:MAG: tetratricopeptide repeat protein [Deltaproteobacteria bacterium]|nr:tetratricopeptide repeat protein [Deltaproteobacteria bacterium]